MQKANNERDNEMDKNLVVLGIYPSRAAVEHAVDVFKGEGFRNADVSALFSTGMSNKDFAHEKGTKLPEGTTTGVASGMVLGGALGWLAGVGSIAVPGLGAFIAAGPIMGLLAGAGVGGAVGGIAGALIGLGFPEYEAKRYEGRVKEGGVLLSVHCDNDEWCDKAKDILERTGAEDISSTGEASSDTESSNRPYPKAANI